jgi:hypothetical protein
MPQEHIAPILTALFAAEVATPQTNPLIVYGAVIVLMAAVALALWASRPLRRGLGQKPLTPRPDGPDGLPWMPGGDIFELGDQPTEQQPQPTYQPPPTYRPHPYDPQPPYQPVAGAPTFKPPVRQPRNPWSTS